MPAEPANTGAASADRTRAGGSRNAVIVGVLLALLGLGALAVAWTTHQRLRTAEQDFARRQQDSASQALEARTLARQAEAAARDAAAKVAVLEARVAENSVQRSQLEELLQSLSRSRDENVLADVDAALRVAIQQAAITGSLEPLAAALRQTDERLARYQQPRLERVRRAALHDLERVRAAAVVDLSSLTLRLDEAIRMVDDLPLVSATDRKPARREPAAARVAEAASTPASAPANVVAEPSATEAATAFVRYIWAEIRSLVRVTQVDHPEAALLAPEQAFFLRENLKLRLLNARLAILSRQFDTAQADLREAQSALDRYFDRSSRRVAAAAGLLKLVSTQARQVTVPQPDATLAAVAAAAAGR